MANIDLKKKVYNKDQFNRVVGGRDFTTFTRDGEGVPFTVGDFFAEYENLFLSIPINGDTNSHEYLVRKSGELVGFNRTTEDIQPLLDEIELLRTELLQARRENINLQVEAAGGSAAEELNQQFADLLAALDRPVPEFPDIEFPDIVFPDFNFPDFNFPEEPADLPALVVKNTQVTLDFANPDNISFSFDSSKQVTNSQGGNLSVTRIEKEPQYGYVEIGEDGITLKYAAYPDLTGTGQLRDTFQYVVQTDQGQQGIGTGVAIIKLVESGLQGTEEDLPEGDTDPDSDGDGTTTAEERGEDALRQQEEEDAGSTDISGIVYITDSSGKQVPYTGATVRITGTGVDKVVKTRGEGEGNFPIGYWSFLDLPGGTQDNPREYTLEWAERQDDDTGYSVGRRTIKLVTGEDQTFNVELKVNIEDRGID